MNCRESHVEVLRTLWELRRSYKSGVTRNMIEEYTKESNDFSLARKWSTCSETAVVKSEEFLNEKQDSKVLTQLVGIRAYVKNVKTSLKAAKEALDLCIKEDKMRIAKKRPVTEGDLGEANQVYNKLEQLENNLNRRKKITEKRDIFFVEHNSQLNRRQTSSKVIKSIRDGNCINDRRHLVRREVLNNRQSNQLKEANLHRGLVMEEDCQAASKSDPTFCSKILYEALPSVSHCKRAPGIKRPWKQQVIAITEM